MAMNDEIYIELDSEELKRLQKTGGELEEVSARMEQMFSEGRIKLNLPGLKDILASTLAKFGEAAQLAMERLNESGKATATEAEIELALKFNAEGKIVLAQLGGTANLKVNLKIKS